MIDAAAILNHVHGTLSMEGCELLADLATKVPANGLIVDLNCNHGRTTISLCHGLQDSAKEGGHILALDPHLDDRTLTIFVQNLRSRGFNHLVTPIIQKTQKLAAVMSTGTAHLVVANIDPYRGSFHDAFVGAADTVKFALRKDGVVVLLCPNDADQGTFAHLSDALFSKFDLDFNSDLIRVYRNKAKPAASRAATAKKEGTGSKGGFSRSSRGKTGK